MIKTELIKNMFSKLSYSIESDSLKKLEENYEYQLCNYEKLFDEHFMEKEERSRSLVCARCLVALSRSLVSAKGEGKNLDRAREEINRLKPLFFQDIRGRRANLRALVEQRIKSLSSQNSDEISDALLFFYISLS